jgi:hypothetical protein
LAELKDGKKAENLVDRKAQKLAVEMDYMLVVMMADMKDDKMVVLMVDMKAEYLAC